MQKRGQITLFFILGLVILVLFALILASRESAMSEDTLDDIQTESQHITQIIEQCMYKSAEEGIFNDIGPQGGVVEPGKSNFSEFQSEKVIYWNDGTTDISPELEEISSNLAKKVLADTVACFGESMSNASFVIKYGEPSAEVSFDEDDIKVDLRWPITLSDPESTKTLDSFSASLPYNFATDFSIAKKLIRDIIDSQPYFYDIYSNCSSYQTNGKTTIHVVSNVAEVKNHVQIISIFDYEPIYSNNQKTLKIQFAIRNITAMGYCDA